MATINIQNLLHQINQKILSTTDNKEILMLSKSVEVLKSGTVFVARTFSSLPSAEENIGKLYLVQNDGIIYFAKDEPFPSWIPITSTYYDRLFSWGTNAEGELGIGANTRTQVPFPVRVCTTDNQWCDIATGYSYRMAIKRDGTIWTWGPNYVGNLGDGTTIARSSPGTIAGASTDWCRISLAPYTAFAIKKDGTLWSWGSGYSGELGNGVAGQRCSPGTVAGGGNNWAILGLGEDRFGAIKSDGTLWTWGNNIKGSLGDGTTVNRSSPVQVVVNGWTSVSNGNLSSSGIKCDGTLWTWGRNLDGELGNGTNDDTGNTSPGTVAGGGTNWCQVSAGGYRTAAIKTDGTLWTWGSGGGGVLGNGTTLRRNSPGTIAGGGTTWCRVLNGEDHTIAIKTDGTLWTWGCNVVGRLGDGTTVSRCSPGTIAGGGATWCGIDAGYGNSIAIKTDGTLWTWGSNGSGQLGDGTIVSRCSPGTVAGGGTTWSSVSIGSVHMAAIKTDGTLWTWGRNISGRLGDGTIVDRCSPGTVAGGGTNWCRVSFAYCTGLAIKTDGTLWTWGNSNRGQLGSGITISRCSPGIIEGGTTDWRTIGDNAPHSNHFGAIKSNGILWAWGRNDIAQLGDGTYTNRCSPVCVLKYEGWCQFSTAFDHSSGVKTDGTLWTWGDNTEGQLGTGTAGAGTSRCSPGTTAGGGTNWCFSNTNTRTDRTSFAIKTDGTLWSWGSNTGGGLVIPLYLGRRCSPGTTIGNYKDWCAVYRTNRLGILLKTDGTLWTWNSNNYSGGSGDGTYIARFSPGTIFGGGNNWCKASAGAYGGLAISSDPV